MAKKWKEVWAEKDEMDTDVIWFVDHNASREIAILYQQDMALDMYAIPLEVSIQKEYTDAIRWGQARIKALQPPSESDKIKEFNAKNDQKPSEKA